MDGCAQVLVGAITHDHAAKDTHKRMDRVAVTFAIDAATSMVTQVRNRDNHNDQGGRLGSSVSSAAVRFGASRFGDDDSSAPYDVGGVSYGAKATQRAASDANKRDDRDGDDGDGDGAGSTRSVGHDDDRSSEQTEAAQQSVRSSRAQQQCFGVH